MASGVVLNADADVTTPGVRTPIGAAACPCGSAARRPAGSWGTS